MNTKLLIFSAFALASTYALGCASSSDVGSSDESNLTESDPGHGPGETCYGIDGVGCKEGLACEGNDTGIRDHGGTCVKSKHGVGSLCGTGIAGLAVSCDEGLRCDSSKVAPGAADAPGTCVAK